MTDRPLTPPFLLIAALSLLTYSRPTQQILQYYSLSFGLSPLKQKMSGTLMALLAVVTTYTPRRRKPQSSEVLPISPVVWHGLIQYASVATCYHPLSLYDDDTHRNGCSYLSVILLEEVR